MRRENSLLFGICSLWYRRWRAYKIIQRIPADQRAMFELKLLAGDYLRERPSFLQESMKQDWKGDYLHLVRILPNKDRCDRIPFLARRKSQFIRLSKIN